MSIPVPVMREVSRWGSFHLSKIAMGWKAEAGKHSATGTTEQEAVENLEKEITRNLQPEIHRHDASHL